MSSGVRPTLGEAAACGRLYPLRHLLESARELSSWARLVASMTPAATAPTKPSDEL
jgi:hypothetical protein